MQVASEFDVAAAPEVVYAALLDLERVGPCIPGASVGEADADGAHPAEIAVRLGPMRLTYRGTVRVAERDPSARKATLLAEVREVRGQGTARARMSMAVAEHGAGAHVAASTEVELSGRAAQMGAGIVEDVAARLVADMASRLEQLLAADAAKVPADPDANVPADAGSSASPAPSAGAVGLAPARPIGGMRLLMRALWQRLRDRRGRSAGRDESSL
jgi:carbon monoxide dehydrogenase subunit G